MRDDLVKRIWECASGECFNCSQYQETTNASVCSKELLHEAADAIEELSLTAESYKRSMEAWAGEAANVQPRWIPVTERLPEIDEKHHCSKDVLAYLKGGGMCFTALEENIFGQTWFECERHPALEEEMIVTHWMPLPEPPKEE